MQGGCYTSSLTIPHPHALIRLLSVLQCLDPKDPAYAPKKAACSGTCSHPSWTGDGVCDGGNNNCGCKYDKGDCCGTSGNKNQYKYCKENCKCIDPAKAKKT